MGGSRQAGNMDNSGGQQGNLGQGFDQNQGNLGQGFDNTGSGKPICFLQFAKPCMLLIVTIRLNLLRRSCGPDQRVPSRVGRYRSEQVHVSGCCTPSFASKVAGLIAKLPARCTYRLSIPFYPTLPSLHLARAN